MENVTDRRAPELLLGLSEDEREDDDDCGGGAGLNKADATLRGPEGWADSDETGTRESETFQ